MVALSSVYFVIVAYRNQGLHVATYHDAVCSVEQCLMQQFVGSDIYCVPNSITVIVRTKLCQSFFRKLCGSHAIGLQCDCSLSACFSWFHFSQQPTALLQRPVCPAPAELEHEESSVPQLYRFLLYCSVVPAEYAWPSSVSVAGPSSLECFT